MIYYIIFPLIALIANLTIGFFVLYKNQKNRLNKTFALFAFSFAIWSIIDICIFAFSKGSTPLYLHRIGSVIADFSAVFILHFVLIFVKSNLIKNKKVFLFYIPALILLYFNAFTNLVYKSIVLVDNAFKIENGPLFELSMLVTIFGYTLSLIILYKHNKKKLAIQEKKQTQLIFIGISIPFVGGFISQVFLPILDINFIPLTTTFSLFLTFLIGYAITKYELMALPAFRTIKAKIVIPIMLFTGIILCLATGYSYFYTVNILENTIAKQLKTVASIQSKHVDTILLEQERNIEVIASSLVFKKVFEENTPDYENNLKLAYDRLDTITEIDKSIYELFILDLSGKIICSNKKENIGIDKSNDIYFTEGLKDTFIKDAYYSYSTEENSITFSTPISCDLKGCLGVLVARIKMDKINTILRDNTGMGKTGEMYIVNQEGYTITPLQFKENSFLKTKIKNENIKNCFKNSEDKKTINIYQDYRKKDVLGAQDTTKIMNWCLLAEIDKNEALEPVKSLLLLSTIRLIIVLLLLFIILYFIVKKITKPLINLEKGIEIVGKGSLDYKVATNNQDEIGFLSRAFDKMTENIKKSRAEINTKVQKQVKEIRKNEEKLIDNQQDMEDQQKAILNILEDVEDEKDKSDLIAHDLEKFKLAVENASDHIVITDPKGITLYANKGVEKITGFTKKEVIGKKAGIFNNWGGKMEEKFYAEMWKTIKEDKQPFSGEVKNHRKNGEEYMAFASLAPVLSKEGEVLFFVGIERDITKEKQIDQAKSEFVSLASHQLRTPLSTINWYVEMLLDGDAGKLNNEQKNYLDEVYRGNQRMVELVNSLLNVSRLELGTFTIEPELIDITKLADGAIEDLAHTISLKKQKIIKKYDKKLTKIKLDKKLTRMIFENLLSNAVKYSPEKAKISIEITKKLKMVEIVISDTGMGIPLEQQDRVFTKLFRADNVRETDTEGTGLGLYIIKQILDQSNGKISFKSEKNKGTKFTIHIPLAGMVKKEGTKKLS